MSRELTYRLMIGLSLLFFVGCGSSGGAGVGNDFVYTGGGQTAQAGSVTFNFVNAQTPLAVPGDTAFLFFRFYTGQNATGTQVRQELVGFEPSVVFSSLSTSIKSAQIQVLNSDKRILGQATVNFTVLAGNNVVVDFSNAVYEPAALVSVLLSAPTNTITFGDSVTFTATGTDQFGQSVTLDTVQWSVSDGDSISVGANDGVVTGIGVGTSTLAASSGGIFGTAQVVVNAADAPEVSLDADPLDVDGTVDAFPNATATSPLANLNGGQLRVRAVNFTDVTINLPGTPSIGTVFGNGSNNVFIDLDTNATPANIQTVLRNATVTEGVTFGMGQLEVTLTDSVSVVTATRDFTVFQAAEIVQLPDNGFVDISGMVGAQTFSLGDDSATGVVDIGFDIFLFGENWRNLFISSNGLVSRNVALPFPFVNPPLPDAAFPSVIAPYWDDLVSNNIFLLTLGTAPNRRAVIQWEDSTHFGGGGLETFQIVFVEGTNRVEFHYEATSEGGAGGSIGIQSDAGTEFLVWANDTANSVTNGLSLQFIAP